MLSNRGVWASASRLSGINFDTGCSTWSSGGAWAAANPKREVLGGAGPSAELDFLWCAAESKSPPNVRDRPYTVENIPRDREKPVNISFHTSPPLTSRLSSKQIAVPPPLPPRSAPLHIKPLHIGKEGGGPTAPGLYHIPDLNVASEMDTAEAPGGKRKRSISTAMPQQTRQPVQPQTPGTSYRSSSVSHSLQFLSHLKLAFRSRHLDWAILLVTHHKFKVISRVNITCRFQWLVERVDAHHLLVMNCS